LVSFIYGLIRLDYWLIEAKYRCVKAFKGKVKGITLMSLLRKKEISNN